MTVAEGPSTSTPPPNPRKRDGTDPNDPVRIYADGKTLLMTLTTQQVNLI